MFWQPDKLKEWHDQVMDFMILNPTATHEQIAGHFGRHAVTVGMVIRSDVFQARLLERRRMRNVKVDETVLEKLDKVAKRSLDLLVEKMQKDAITLPMEDIRETSEMALNALGYGTAGKSAASSPSQNVNIFVSADDLAKARALMRKGDVVDAEFEQVGGAGR